MDATLLMYQAQIYAYNAEVEAMKAANMVRALDKDPPKYGEQDFIFVSSRLTDLAQALMRI